MPTSEGWLYTRQDLTNHDPADALPYPVVKKWFSTEAKAEAHAAKARERFGDDPNQLIRVRPAEGWSLIVKNADAPEGTKPRYLTYATYTEAQSNLRYMALQGNPGVTFEIVPYVVPEKKPGRPRQHAASEGPTIDAEETF